MLDIFTIAMWAARYVFAHIAFGAQRVKLAPVMKNMRLRVVSVALVAIGLGPLSLAHGVPATAPVSSGSNYESRDAEFSRHDGISLDEAVRRAEAQYRARVVRTEVQDEDGRKVYVLKLLSEGGRVITVRIDAATGRMR
ncbi:MAG TPA: PepSY domain-containing protein [Steroidobacteraceae bacterium]|nr:PepSY domain-containing protein [Steroidobacteraceae bacterium]